MTNNYPLNTLLRVRVLREDSAMRAVKAAENALNEARLLVAEKEKALAEYRIWWKEEEERRYLQIMLQNIVLDEFDKFRAGLTRLKDGEIIRKEEVEKAAAAMREAATKVEEAKKNFLRAHKDEQKIAGHQDIWLQEQAKEFMRLEDLEMEDFHGKNVFSTITLE
jgi:type III secretion protein O